MRQGGHGKSDREDGHPLGSDPGSEQREIVNPEEYIVSILTRERGYCTAEEIFNRDTFRDPIQYTHHSKPGKICVPSALTPSNFPPSIPNASKINGAICVVKTFCVNFCAFVIRGLLTKQATFLSSALRPPCSSTFFLEVVKIIPTSGCTMMLGTNGLLAGVPKPGGFWY